MGSTEMTFPPRWVISDLNAAGPSPQPRMRWVKSFSVRVNILTYSLYDRPQGTTFSSVNFMDEILCNLIQQICSDVPIATPRGRKHRRGEFWLSRLEIHIQL